MHLSHSNRSALPSASVVPDAVESSLQPSTPSAPSQLTVTLRSATARVASVALMVSNHDEAALHLTVEKMQASLQEVGNAFQGGVEVAQLSLSLPGVRRVPLDERDTCTQGALHYLTNAIDSSQSTGARWRRPWRTGACRASC